MDKKIDKNEIKSLEYKCLKSIKKENIFFKKIYQNNLLFRKFIYEFLMKNAIK